MLEYYTWGLYLFPIVNSFVFASKIDKFKTYPDGHIYHVYTNMDHEQWSKNSNNAYCKEYNKSTNIYYELEKTEFSLFF